MINGSGMLMGRLLTAVGGGNDESVRGRPINCALGETKLVQNG